MPMAEGSGPVYIYICVFSKTKIYTPVYIYIYILYTYVAAYYTFMYIYICAYV